MTFLSPSPRCYRLLEAFEVFRPTAYKDIRGVWTIGYGHTEGVREGDTCTMAQAEAWLGQDTMRAAIAVNKHVTVPLTQNQFDALVSLTFNIGVTAFEESTLLRKLNDKDYAGAAEEFLSWKRAGSKRNALLQRREKEKALFEGIA